MDKITKPLRIRLDKLDKAVLARIEKGEDLEEKNVQAEILMKDLMWQDRFLHIIYDLAPLVKPLTKKKTEKMLELLVKVISTYDSEFADKGIYPIAMALINGQLLEAYNNVGERICSLAENVDPVEAANILGDSVELVLTLHDRATKRFLKQNFKEDVAGAA